SRADRDVDADRSARRSDRGAQEEGVKSSSELRSAFLAAATTAGGSAALSRPVCWPIRPTKGVSALTAAMRTARFRQASVNERAPPELTWKGATTSKGPPPPGLALADRVIDPLARLAGAAEARVTVPVRGDVPGVHREDPGKHITVHAAATNQCRRKGELRIRVVRGGCPRPVVARPTEGRPGVAGNLVVTGRRARPLGIVFRLVGPIRHPLREISHHVEHTPARLAAAA